MKKILKGIKWVIESLLFGLVLIFLFNIIGVYVNLNIPINIWTILVVGILRIPGLAMLAILSIIG
jgi:inhibitor of the pro-sigma K processing machinery